MKKKSIFFSRGEGFESPSHRFSRDEGFESPLHRSDHIGTPSMGKWGTEEGKRSYFGFEEGGKEEKTEMSFVVDLVGIFVNAVIYQTSVQPNKFSCKFPYECLIPQHAVRCVTSSFNRTVHGFHIEHTALKFQPDIYVEQYMSTYSRTCRWVSHRANCIHIAWRGERLNVNVCAYA